MGNLSSNFYRRGKGSGSCYGSIFVKNIIAMDLPYSVSTLPTEGVSFEGKQRDFNLKAFARLLHEKSCDVNILGQALLDGLLEYLGCERGFLLKGTMQSEDPTIRGRSIQVISARTVLSRNKEESRIDIADQADPELIIQPSIVQRAIKSDQLVLERNCLVQLMPPGAEVHRTVLCKSFKLNSCEMGAIYLDMAVVDPDIMNDLLIEFEELLGQGLPILRNIYLELEVKVLQKRLGSIDPQIQDAYEESEMEGIPGETDEKIWDVSENELPVYYGIIGKSKQLLEIYEVVERIKDTDFNICIFGESGSGKELLAKAIHDAGKRREHKFITENCGAIVETLLESELFGHVKGAFTGAEEDKRGLFELADGGTLFLDEIGDMSEGMQRKLLRVLQEGIVRPVGSKESIKIDVRVICASNRDLRILLENGSFRSDLYYRLNVISLEMPSLRDRIDDVPYLVKKFLMDFRKDGIRRRLSESAMKGLMAYNWPGNVRELANVLQRLVISSSKRIITRKEILPLLTGGPAKSYISEDLECDGDENQIILRIPQRQTFNEIISECEKAVLLNALKENRWNKSRVTKILKIPRQSLYNKIAKYKLSRKWPSNEEYES